MRAVASFLGVVCVLAGCGISKYPGQPGVRTNSYSKLDLENLADTGLYVYEASYDNRLDGAGMGAIVTKYHAGALTFTATARTNADGTFYRAKTAYGGAKIDMISLPQQNQILLPPDSTVLLFAEYDLSLDEIDDKNLSEASLFAAPIQRLSAVAKEMMELRRDWLAAGVVGPTGRLSYQFTKLHFGDVTFEPAAKPALESNFAQNAMRVRVEPATLRDFIAFFEAQFPKGYRGVIGLELAGGSILRLPMGLHTRVTAAAAGIQVEENGSPDRIRAILESH